MLQFTPWAAATADSNPKPNTTATRFMWLLLIRSASRLRFVPSDPCRQICASSFAHRPTPTPALEREKKQNQCNSRGPEPAATPARPPHGSQLANHCLSIKYNLRGSGFGVLFGYFEVGKVTKGPVYPVTEMILHPAAPETALLQIGR